MSDDDSVEVLIDKDEDDNDNEDLDEEGRQLALNLLKHYQDVKAAAAIAGVAATSLMGLIIKITGQREQAVENFIRAFRATIDDETNGWEEIPEGEEEVSGPEPGQTIN